MAANLRARIARWIAPGAKPPALTAAEMQRVVQATALRMYQNARPTRNAADYLAGTSSANSELASSLAALRNRSRALVRDNSYAKRAKTIVINNVIGGTGIGLQAAVKSTRGELNKRACAGIEAAFEEWSRASRCHTGGALAFADLERLLEGELFEAGEVFIRMHFRAFGDSPIPFALEVIEAERIADQWTQANPPPNGGIARMGIEVDAYDRPLAYWIQSRHPGELRQHTELTARVERVPAEQIIHLRLTERWPQARGVPWLHTVIQRLRDSDGYAEAEIVAARASACFMGFIKSPEEPLPQAALNADGTTSTTPPSMEFQPGMIDHLGPGEDFISHNPNRPNPALAEFMRAMLREVAAGTNVSYEALSRDYSQSNYSSSRLALLDDREMWRMLQGAYIRAFRVEVHRLWLRQAVLAGAVAGVSVAEYVADPAKFEAARWKPRGWGWIDPTKEVAAYKEAVRNGFKTVGDVISETGGGADLEDLLEARANELEQMEEKGLVFDTDPEFGKPEPAPASSPTPQPTDEDDDAEDKPEDDETKTSGAGRVLHLNRGA